MFVQSGEQKRRDLKNNHQNTTRGEADVAVDGLEKWWTLGIILLGLADSPILIGGLDEEKS